jgi:hypothetical protein
MVIRSRQKRELGDENKDGAGRRRLLASDASKLPAKEK